jgi:hypothetical protein
MKLINSLFFLLLFISPHIIYSVMPKNFISVFHFIMPFLFFVLALKNISFFFNKKFILPLLFSMSFLIFGIINLIAHQEISIFNLIAPIVAFMGFCFIYQNKIDLRIFDFFLVLMYVFFYCVYFSVIPDLFFRPGFDEDEVVFDNSSSNAIPMALNMTLYAYMILNKFYLESNNKKIFIFSIINLAFVIIQQSRAGLVVSILLVLIALFNYDKKKMLKVLVRLSLIVISIIVYYYNEIINFIDIVGSLNAIDALNEDIRGEAQRSFFKNLDLSRIIFGYDKNFVYAVEKSGDILYTFNVFLDMWNKYSLFQFVFFFVVILFRIINHSKFYFSLYFFIPFFVYSMVESIFFPNFWDCIIYILLFALKVGHGTPQANQVLRSRERQDIYIFHQ